MAELSLLIPISPEFHLYTRIMGMFVSVDQLYIIL